MIEQLLPAGVVSVEAFADVSDELPFPGEERFIADAVPRRRGEFITARRCAREALARLGFPPAPILRRRRGEPQWPLGVAGSITHCAGYRAAAVCRIDDPAMSIGIDAEPHAPLPSGVLDAVTVSEDRAALARLSTAQPAVHWDRLLFSSKEAIFKAWYPLTRRELEFDQCRLDIHPSMGSFVGTMLVDTAPPLIQVAGRYTVARGLIVTAVAVAP